MPRRFSGKRQTGLDVFAGEIREVSQDFCFTHAAREVFEDVSHSHSRSTNGWFAAPLSRLDGDDLAIIHEGMITKRIDLAR